MRIPRILLLLFLGVAVWNCQKNRPETLKTVSAAGSDYDLAYQLPGSPIGIATDGRELVTARRNDPWGVMRVRRDGDELEVQTIPIIEERFKQKIQLDAITFNGTNYVGYTSASWFGLHGNVFTVHDRASLKIVSHHPAPEHLGCLAWDGSTYWAATRRNTRDSLEEVHLYRFDRAFQLIGTYDAPSVGCQGLAWDGKLLWHADVFDDAIHTIDVSGGKARVVKKAETPLSYLSGIAAFEDHIWIAEYDTNRLHRVRPATRVAWSGGVRVPAAAAPVLASAVATPAAGGANVDDVRAKLRSEDRFERMRAGFEIERLGFGADFRREQNSFFERNPEDTDMIDWQLELRDGGLWATWRAWFGHDLFRRESQSGPITLPLFARYTITITRPDGTEVEREYEAIPGENVRRDVALLENATAPGEYRVSFFMHVQYITPGGQARILNNSEGSLTVRKD